MDKSVSKRRKKLNTEQLEVLELLYKFRFGSNDLFAQYFGKKDRSFVYKRLLILLEQGLVGKRFDSSYRLQGKPAAYYLTPEGARRLQTARGIEVNIKVIYKDKSVSEQFVRYSLDLFTIYSQLRAQYGDSLKFFTKANLNREEYDYFPHPLPDAYIRLEDKQFFLDVFHDDQPFFVVARRIKQYVDYDEEGDWAVTETDLPVVLLVSESSGFAKKLQKCVLKIADGSEVSFAIVTKSKQLNEDLRKTLTLQDI
jgi:hypothetical protein